MVAEMVPKCNCIADIGTDHAFLPINLIEEGKCNYAIASDIKEGPVKVASRNIFNNRLQDRIETRMGSGLDVVKVGECEVIVIAGMGGLLICEILENNCEIAHTTKQIIVQPMNAQKEVRHFLLSNGYEIVDERSARDGKHVYLAIRCMYSPHTSILPKDKIDLHTGNIMCGRMDINAVIYYQNMLVKTGKILRGLEKTLYKDDEYEKKWNEYSMLKKKLENILTGV